MAAKATGRKLCYPHPKGSKSTVNKNYLHTTEGIAHNYALDYMAPGGTPVLAVEIGTILRCSGHDPSQGVIGGDIYGWNTYLITKDGLIYFYTHQDRRYVKYGDRVKRGDIIGRVGSWPGDPGRSHTHLGVTHPMGDKASRRACLNVADAPRVKGNPITV